MKFFGHDTDAFFDKNMRKVVKIFGAPAYAVYWYCLENVGRQIDPDNLTFELDADSEIIALDLQLDSRDVDNILQAFVGLGMFEKEGEIFTVRKMARRLKVEQFTSRRRDDVRRKLNEVLALLGDNSRFVTDVSLTCHDLSQTCPDKGKETKGKETKDKDLKDSLSSLDDDNEKYRDAINVLEYLNSVCGTRYKKSTKSHIQNINARLNDGYSAGECKAVIDLKNQQWGNDQKMADYLRPQTLFSASKFPGYVKATKTTKTGINQIGTNFDKPEGWK